MTLYTKEILNEINMPQMYARCQTCGNKYDEWIELPKIEDFCIDCAQNMTRILLEKIIEYHNGKSVSLLDIMQHGNPKDIEMLTFWLEERFPEFYPEKTEEYLAFKEKGSSFYSDYVKSYDSTEDMLDNEESKQYCEVCEKELNRWIDILPGRFLCIDCAQFLMRTTLEDIIEYHNGVRVSLEDTMFYGSTKIDEIRASFTPEQIEQFHARLRYCLNSRSNSDKEIDES